MQHRKMLPYRITQSDTGAFTFMQIYWGTAVFLQKLLDFCPFHQLAQRQFFQRKVLNFF